MEDHERDWFENLIAKVESEVCDGVESDARFPNAGTLLTRFRGSGERLLDRGLEHLGEFREVLNEVGVASRILNTPVPPAARLLEYEPRFAGTDQTIDFRVGVEGWDDNLYVEVKTIHPEMVSRWDQFRWVLENRLLPDNVLYVVDEDWLGGELWHFRVASRARMLEYACQFEERIRNCLAEEHDAMRCLAFCGDGSRWHLDELEDFVAYYRFGRHRRDDPLARMEAYYVTENQIELDRSIHCFGFIRRSDSEVLPSRVIWNVRTPSAPWGTYGL